jgi:hypothetical protein
LTLLASSLLVSCAPDPVQQAYDRCVSSAVTTARNASSNLPILSEEQRKQLEGTIKTTAEGGCGIIKSVCETDRDGAPCQTLLKSAGVNP